MKKIILQSLTVAIFCLCLASIPASAQSEKVPVRLIPKPSTTSHMKMTQEVDLEMTMVSPNSETPPVVPPMKMQMKSSFGFTVKNGAADKQGHIQSELTYDDASSEMTMNGTPAPLGDEIAKFIGKRFTIIYDEKGNLIDLKTSVDLPLPVESLKEVMRSLYGNLPTEPMSMGETAILPLKLTLPIPVPGAGPLNMEGSVKSKLLAIDKDGADRIAKFQQTLEANLKSSADLPGPNGEPIKMSFDFRMQGGGATEINLDRGIVKSGELKTDLEGKLSLPDKSGSISGFTLKGVTKVSVTGSN